VQSKVRPDQAQDDEERPVHHAFQVSGKAHAGEGKGLHQPARGESQKEQDNPVAQQPATETLGQRGLTCRGGFPAAGARGIDQALLLLERARKAGSSGRDRPLYPLPCRYKVKPRLTRFRQEAVEG
jgi:hypothetical protein